MAISPDLLQNVDLQQEPTRWLHGLQKLCWICVSTSQKSPVMTCLEWSHGFFVASSDVSTSKILKK